MTTLSSRPFAAVAIFCAIGVGAWAAAVIRKLARGQAEALARALDFEARLNETEALLTAEPHVLVIWHGRADAPARLVGDMRGTAKVPATLAGATDFPAWLEAESAAALERAIAVMREAGTAFNLGVRSLAGELLEADGRTAGGLATLRLRPLAGERRHAAELASDARRLGGQVERLSAVLDSAPLPVWLRGVEGQLIWVNQAYVRAVEASNVEAVLSGRIEITDRRDPEPAPTGPGNGPAGLIHAVIGGAKRALDIHEAPLAQGSAGFAVDMTALEDARKELKRHVEAHAGTLDKLATAIAIFGPDQRLRFHNTAYAKLWSLDPRWLAMAPSDGEILDRLRAQRMLQEHPSYKEWKARQLEAYTRLETREDWWYLPDGRAIRVVAEQHPFGGVTYLYDNATDEIQLKSRYNELIKVQRETLDNLNEGVVLFGTDGRLRVHNRAFGRLWSLGDEFLDRQPHVDDIIAEARKLLGDEAHWDEIKYGVTGLDTGRKPLKGRVKRPDDLVLDVASVPLPDGNTLLTYANVTDSARVETALREHAEALEATNRLKTGFMSNVSYHLRTPLTSILGYAEALTLGYAGALQPKQKEYLGDIEASSKELLGLINRILDLAKIDAGAMELTLANVDVVDLMRETAQGFAQWIGQRDLTLSIEVPQDAAQFVADGRHVGQILRNLLDNAIGFSEPGGAIRMGARLEGGDMLLWVADQGRGIAPDFQKLAFDRFQAQPIAGSRRGPGLGLAIVKSFVELHGGRVTLLSRPGKGTTVVCRFPASGPAAAHGPSGPAAHAAA